jgi:hypothetical protein
MNTLALLFVLGSTPVDTNPQHQKTCAPMDATCLEQEDALVDRDMLLKLMTPGQVQIQGEPATSKHNKHNLSTHTNIVKELAGLGQCTDYLLSAQWRQDLLEQSTNAAHFDNCAFSDGAKYIEVLVARAQDAAARYRKAGSAVEKDKALRDGGLALGKALHAVQDFYAHSTFLEIADESEAKSVALDAIALPQLWTAEGREELTNLVATRDLRSGTWPLPVNGKEQCGADAGSHGELAKDSSKTTRGGRKLNKHPHWGKNHHEAARALSARASAEFLRATVPIEFAMACGPRFGYLVLTDSRK